jgi:integrase
MPHAGTTTYCARSEPLVRRPDTPARGQGSARRRPNREVVLDPALPTPSSNALWLRARGVGALTPESISKLIGGRTEAEFGDRISPHRFRHCAASTIAVFAPSEIRTAVGLLDHSSARTTHQHYILARGIEASRHYAKIVADQRPKGLSRSRWPRG